MAAIIESAAAIRVGRVDRGEASIISDIDLQTGICLLMKSRLSLFWAFMLASIISAYEGHVQKRNHED